MKTRNIIMENMKVKPRAALGRGLSALISSAAVPVNLPVSTTTREILPPVETVQTPELGLVESNSDDSSSPKVKFLPTEKIVKNPLQPRKEFEAAELAELTESIKVHGVLQPVLVRTLPNSSDFEIVAGERRWRAATAAGLKYLPVIIHDFTDKEALEIALVENLQRENLNAIEQALAFQRLINEFSLSQEQVAERVGKERTTVANYIRLLALPAEVQQLITEGKLLVGHAKAILTIKEPSAQLSLARKSVKESLSVRALEAIVSRVIVLDGGRRSQQSVSVKFENIPTTPTSFPDACDRLRNSLGTKVLIKHHKSGRGRIEIEYFSESELDRIIEQICR